MEELRNDIISTINKSGLPLDCIYYIVKDVYRETLDAYNAVLKDKKEKENKKDESITLTSVDQNAEREKGE